MVEFSFSKVSKSYNPGLFKRRVLALQDFTCEMYRGEVFGLIGPNGAGKSTTIRLLLGLSRPDRGEILFRGSPPKNNKINEEIGYLPENPYLYDHLTLSEMLDFCGRTSGLSPHLRKLRGEELLEKLAMADVQNRPMRTFSKGMLQRAGICFALLHDPSIIILDEPMSGLDPIGRRLVFNLVKELKGNGKTVFFCSHILSDVERLCDRIGVLNGGRLVKTIDMCPPESIEARPLHLALGFLTDEQRQALLALGGELTEEGGGIILSFEENALHKFSTTLTSLGVRVVGTRTEKLSLEKIFMDIIAEGGRRS